jgi:hypothetical protein
VQLLVTDRYGQSTLTPSAPLKIDGQPPAVKIARADGDHAVSVRVNDGESGVDTGAVSVSFGDGHEAKGRTRFEHRYARPGVYQVVVRVRDKLGIEGTVRQWVSVR